MKYVEFAMITEDENHYLNTTDVDAWKCRYQLGLETLLAYTVNYEYLINMI